MANPLKENRRTAIKAGVLSFISAIVPGWMLPKRAIASETRTRTLRCTLYLTNGEIFTWDAKVPANGDADVRYPKDACGKEVAMFMVCEAPRINRMQ